MFRGPRVCSSGLMVPFDFDLIKIVNFESSLFYLDQPLAPWTTIRHDLGPPMEKKLLMAKHIQNLLYSKRKRAF